MKLTLPVMKKIHKGLLQRQLRNGDHGVSAVGIGWAWKSGRPRPVTPGPVVVYAVKEKKEQLLAKRKIEPTVRVPVPTSRGKRRHASFPTDVVQLSGGFLTSLRGSFSGSIFAAGALVAWGPPEAGLGGILTVAHAVPRTGIGTSVDLQWQRYTVAGRVIGITPEVSWLDASMIQLPLQSIEDSPLSPIFQNSTGVSFRTVAQLIDDGRVNHPRGMAFTADGPRPFTVTAFFPSQNPQNPILQDAPQLRNLLVVRGGVNEFEPGTSGSPWAASPTLADAIQVGGYTGRDPVTGEILPFYMGIGQPIELYLSWAKSVVRQPVRLLAVI